MSHRASAYSRILLSLAATGHLEFKPLPTTPPTVECSFRHVDDHFKTTVEGRDACSALHKLRKLLPPRKA